MTEERKYAILFAATLLSARRIVDVLDSSKPGKDFFIDKAIKEAAPILEKMKRWISGSAVASDLTIGVGRRHLGVAPGALRFLRLL